MKHLVAGIPWSNSDKQKEWLIVCFYMSGLRKTRAFKKKPGGLRKRNGLRKLSVLRSGLFFGYV